MIITILWWHCVIFFFALPFILAALLPDNGAAYVLPNMWGVLAFPFFWGIALTIFICHFIM